MALSELYVDPSIAGNSGAGTIGDPYGDLQYAFATATFDTTNGTRINIKAGTAEVLAAALNVSTGFSAAPTRTAVLVLQGYTAVAGDGDWDAQTGIAEIDCNGSTMFAIKTLDYTHFTHLKIGGSAGGGYDDLINMDDYNVWTECEIHTHAGTGMMVEVSLSNIFNRCYFHTITGGSSYALLFLSAGNTVMNSNFVCTNGNYPTWAIIGMGSYACNSINNVIVSSGKGRGIAIASRGQKIIGNSLYSIAPNSGIEGIYASSYSGTGTSAIVADNVVEHFSNGIRLWGGVPGQFTGNYVANCGNANYDVTISTPLARDNEDSTVSPFQDAANFDFRPMDVGNMKNGGNSSAITTHATGIWKGAIQPAPTERRPSRRSARRPARR